MNKYDSKINSSTLNNDIIPSKHLLQLLDNYFPRFSSEIVQSFANGVGFQTKDERVYKVISIVVEQFLINIISRIRQINSKGAKEKKTHITLRDLIQALEQSGIQIKKPPFLEEINKSLHR